MASGKGALLTMKLDDKEFRKHIKEILRKGGDVRPVFKKLGVWMTMRSIPETFEKQGRRPKWKECGPYTLGMRLWRSTSPNAKPRRVYHEKVLIQSRALMERNTFIARPNRLDVGTTYAYGAAHQFGLTVRAPRRWKKRTTVKLKVRRWLAIWPKDVKKGEEFAVWHLKKLVPGAR